MNFEFNPAIWLTQNEFRVEDVSQLGHHLGLDRQLLVEQRQVVLQLGVVGDEDPLAFGVVLRPTRTTQHLEDV